MAKTIKLENKEYEVDKLSEKAQLAVKSLTFANQKLEELINMQAILQRAKNSYMDGLKMEMLSDKSGFLFDDE